MSVIICNEKNQNSSNTFTLFQELNCWNPYYAAVESRGKRTLYELNNILFFNESGVQTKTSRGWFGSNNYISSISFTTEKPIRLKNAPKEEFDFSKIDYPFVTKDISESYQKRYCLYIPISDLPKFEASYSKEGKMIRKYTDIGLPDPIKNYVGETVEYLHDSLIIRSELDDMLEDMQKNYVYQKTDKDFADTISNFTKKREELKKAIEFEENYTVEDYLSKNHNN